MTCDVSRFYDTFAPFYPALDLFLQKHKRDLAKRVNQEKPGRLLEIGVGRGDLLARYTHSALTGIDTSEGMLAFARKNAPEGCTLHVMDAAALAFPDASFDYIVMAYVLSVVPDATKVLDEAHRVLRSGGKIFIINHESTGRLDRTMSKVLEPVVAKVLKFTTSFELGPAIDTTKFTVAERHRSGVVPKISRFTLQKK